jgi:uncharacterized protein
MESVKFNPFKVIKAREVVCAFLITNVLGSFVLLGLSRLTGISGKDPFWTAIGYGLTVVPWAGWLLWRLRSTGADLPAFFGKLPKTMRWGRLFGLMIAGLFTSLGAFMWLGYVWHTLNPDSMRYLLDRMMRLQAALRPTDSVMPNLSRVLTFITLIIAAPLCEEVIFRGVLLQRWATKWNPPIALILTSLLFGALHVNIVGAGILGLIAGVLYFKTKSLWASVALHAMNNTIASLSLVTPKNLAGAANPDPAQIDKMFSQGWTGVTCLVLALPWVIRFLWKNWPQKSALTPYQANQLAKAIDSSWESN